MKKILFVCVENAGRSQMAEGFAKRYGKGKVEAISAGTMPSTDVDPIVVQVMQETDSIIVMGCDPRGFCPASFLSKVADWKLEDPKGKPIEKVREIRDEIERRVKKLIGAAV
jgi:protein-tyrosine-phosphatase